MSIPNYKKKYLDEVRPHLMKKFEFTSIMQVPKIEKITLNIGIGNAKDNKKALQSALEELMLITGQKPVVTTAKKDISNFKVRRGFPVGCKVTLRKDFMYEFLERLCANRIPKKDGSIILTHMLNSKGRIQSELTITRFPNNIFYVLSSTAVSYTHLTLPTKA